MQIKSQSKAHSTIRVVIGQCKLFSLTKSNFSLTFCLQTKIKKRRNVFMNTYVEEGAF